ncbi:MAG: carboxypeptidase-like regulatory domain-containing protein [Planctomycetota bacterium]
MGKGGFFLTFLVVLLLLAGAWYILVPRGEPGPDRPEAAGETDGEKTVEPPPPEPAPALSPVTAAGLVLDAKSREPVAGARVELFDRVTVTTDSRGAWKAELARSLAVRRIDVRGRVTADGFLERRTGFRLPLDGATTGVRPVLLSRISARVSGRVRFADGRPATGARVEDRVTGEDGRYGPVPVGAGRVRLVADVKGHPSGTTTIDVEPGAIRDLTADIWIPDSTPYSGRILDDAGQPLAGARVGLGGTVWMSTGEDGTFSFPGVSGGYGQLEFRDEGWRPFRRPILPGVPLEVTLVKGGVLDAVLHDAAGSPVGSGYEMSLLGQFDSEVMYRTTTAADGGFRMTLPVGGPVEIEARREEVLCGRFVVEVVPDAVTEREFTLAAAENLAVRVVSEETGVPIPGAIVFGGWPEPVAGKTDALGGVDVPMPPRTLPNTHLRIVVHHPDHLARTVVVPSLKHLPGEVRVVEVAPRGSIRVRVVDADDRPVPGATVVVSRQGTPSHSTCTGLDGTVDAVAPRGRLVSVLASHPRFGVQTTGATAPAEITIRLAGASRPGTKRVRVLDDQGAPIPGAWVQSYGFKRRPTDETGHVEVPAHLDWLHVMAPGRATALVDIEHATGEKLVPVRLSAGRDLEVTVVDEAGRGVRGARLHVSDEMDRGIPCPMILTDGRGRALLRGMPAKTPVLVSAGHHGFAAVRSWVPGDATTAELRLPRMGVIRVNLAGGRRAGQPFRFRWRTTDRAPYLDDYGSGEQGSVPDATGVVRLSAPPGRVALLFSCAGGAARIWPDLHVPAGGEVEVSYDFPEPGSLDLRVMDDGDSHVEGARIFVTGIHEHLGWTTSRGRIPEDKRGGLPVGRVRLAITAEGRPTVWTEPLDLSAPGPITIVMPAGSAVDGILLDGEGRAVAGRVRVLTEVDRPTAWTVTDADGTFRLPRRLAPGEHRIVIRTPGHRPKVETVRIGEGPTTTLQLSMD